VPIDGKAIRFGSLIWAEVSSPKDGTTKRRPILIVSTNSDIAAGRSIVGVAISTTLLDYPSTKYFDMPWSADGKCTTGLRRHCAAVLNWLIIVDVTKIESIAGHLPREKLEELSRRLLEFTAEARSKKNYDI
jgi:hypothetical protein